MREQTKRLFQYFVTVLSFLSILFVCGLHFMSLQVHLGPVVRKPINANPRLKVNRGFHLVLFF